MRRDATHAQETLDAWRERGADRLDPVRFHLIEALDRRAVRHSGEARRILDDRVSRLIEDYAADVERAASSKDEAGRAGSPCVPARGPLAGLVDCLDAGHARANDRGSADGASRQSGCGAELELLEYFRETWSRVSTGGRLRQSLDEVPRNAGPLNSQSLVHRSLSLMRELSPGYLQHFLSYVDALSWMEQMNGGVTLPVKETPRAGSAKKGARGKAR